MGVIQGAMNRIVGSISGGIIAGVAAKKLGISEDIKKEPNIDIEMRNKALKTAQQKIDAINQQHLGRNNRMKAIRGVIDDFSKQDFTKGGSK